MRLGALLLSLAVPFLLAGEVATDVGRCFAELTGLGAVDAAQASYVQFDDPWKLEIENPLSYEFGMVGNAWMLSEERDAERKPVKGVFLVNGTEVREVVWRTGDRWQRASTDPLALPADGMQTANRWTPADPAGDVRMAMRFLRWLRGERFPDIHFKPDACGRLVLFAHQVHQRGDAEGAARIMEELVRRAGSLERLTAQAVDLIADAQCRRVHGRFQADGDWAAYRDGVKALLGRYAGRWSMADGAALLLESIARRLAEPQAAPRRPETGPLMAMTLDQQRLAAELAGLRAIRRKPEYGPNPVLWVVPSSWVHEGMPTDADLAIRSQGVAAIPFLLALVGDDLLTGVDAARVCGRRFSRPPREREREKAFAQLDRPATRGEVAICMLREILPESVVESYDADDELLKKASAFQAKYGGATEDRLMADFLPGRYGELNDRAVDVLLGRAGSRSVPGLEAFLLAEELRDAWGMGIVRPAEHKVDLLARYAARRGPAAQELVGRFATLLRHMAGQVKKPENRRFSNPAEERSHLEEQRKGLEQWADRVAGLHCPSDLDRLLDRPDAEPFKEEMVKEMLAALPLREAAGMLLRRAVASGQPSASDDLERRLRAIAFDRDTQRVPGLSPTDHADAWRTLITGSSKILLLNEALFAKPLRHAPRLTEEGRRGGGLMDAEAMAKRLIDDHGACAQAFLEQRVRARLAGTAEDALPPYPCDAPLAAADGTAVKARLAAAASREEAQALMAALPLAEREALPDLLRGDPVLNARLQAFAGVITAIQASPADTAMAERLARWRGRALCPELVGELEAWCRTEAESGRPAHCTIGRHRDFAGTGIVLEVTAAPVAEEALEKGERMRIVGWCGVACAPGIYGGMRRRTAPMPVARSWRTIESSDRYAEQAFRAAAAQVAGTAVPACAESFIHFSTRQELQR